MNHYDSNNNKKKENSCKDNNNYDDCNNVESEPGKSFSPIVQHRRSPDELERDLAESLFEIEFLEAQIALEDNEKERYTSVQMRAAREKLFLMKRRAEAMKNNYTIKGKQDGEGE